MDNSLQISLTEATAHLTKLVRRAELGDGIVFNRLGRAAVHLVPIAPIVDAPVRRRLLESLQVAASARSTLGPEAARQYHLYDDGGLPD